MNATPPTLTLTRPDDWHLHVRDGEAMAAVVPATARQFARAIVMPNLRPPVITAEQAVGYRDRIRAAVPAGMAFEPLMVLYLTDNTPAEEAARAKAMGAVAFKLYPAGATTNSDAGVTDMRKTYKVLEAMQREGLVLCVHGEVTDSDVDVFDRRRKQTGLLVAFGFGSRGFFRGLFCFGRGHGRCVRPFEVES